MLLATEKSDKAKGTVAEEATAAKMMFLAKKRGSVPKDLGIDLLILKDKRESGKSLTTKALEQKTQVLQMKRQSRTCEFGSRQGLSKFL